VSVRVGIIGTGNAARHHVLAARAVPGLHVVAVAGREASRTRAFVERETPTSEAMSIPDLLRADVDALIVAVPADAQPPLAIAAFENGRHVLCEKPLAPDVESAAAIESAWRASGRVGVVNFCYRLIPEIESFKQQVASGACGDLQLLHAEWILSSRLDATGPHGWKGNPAAGGGALHNFGSHVLDYLFHDVPDVRLLSATDSTFASTMTFEQADGCPVVVHLSLVTRPAVGHRVIARGSRGTLAVYNASRDCAGGPFRLAFSSDAPAAIDTTPTQSGGLALSDVFVRVLSRFVNAIRGDGLAGTPDIAAGAAAARRVADIRRAASVQAVAR